MTLSDHFEYGAYNGLFVNASASEGVKVLDGADVPIAVHGTLTFYASTSERRLILIVILLRTCCEGKDIHILFGTSSAQQLPHSSRGITY